jgi:hypothetical protein
MKINFLFLVLAVKLSNSILLDCQYFTNTWYFIGDFYTCHAQLIKFGDDRQVVGVSQNHSANKNDDDVYGLEIIDQEMNFFLEGIANFFKNIHGFRMYNNKLKFIPRDDLKPFPELQYLNLYINQIQTLDGDLLINNPKLQYLGLNENLITSIGWDFFRPISLLKEIDLKNNLCINFGPQTPSEILMVSREILFKCPSTPKMTERMILNGAEFNMKVNLQVSKEIKSLKDELKHEITSLEIRIEEMEKIIREIFP